LPRDLIDELLEGRVKATLFGGDRAPRLGRLVILEPIGTGAMGTVFAAFDPRLDRKVAVKLVRGTGDDATARVLAEARALGKLTHPNVVTVHDADEVDGSVYIVMELAPGRSLRAWIAERPAWREVVDVMAQVARGLAAAHRAGLVHRDIKPDNILLGPDRVRLVDFGLAARREGGDDISAGTPSYMAPEALTGESATEASDQFSFGVTLFEALYGERPHQGGTRVALALAAAEAAAARRPAGTEVPAWLHAIAIRTLAADPARRFPSMDVVVGELARDRRRRKRIAAVSAAVLVALGVTGVVAYRGGATARDLCAGGTRAAAVAPADVTDRLQAAFGAAPWVERAATELREFAGGWAASFRAVCEATRVHGSQSDTLYALRMRCLDRRLDRVTALTTALAAAGRLEPEAVEEATVALASLPRPADCERLTDPGELALPDDAAARARALAAEHGLDRAWATYSLGRYAEARGQLQPLLDATAGLDAPGVRAGVLVLAASIEGRIGDPRAARTRLDEALAAAARARAAELEAAVWARILRAELFTGDPAKVIEWAPFARAAAARAGLEGAEIDGVIGEALRDAGDLVLARTVLAHALASADPLLGYQRALIELNLGAGELAAGNPAAADAALAHALATAEAALGAEHPALALYIEKQAAAARARGAIAAALAAGDRVLALRRAAFGDDDRAVATARLRRAQTLIEGGRIAEAGTELAAARAIRTRIHGEGHIRLGEIELVAGDAALAAGRTDAARAAYHAAVALDPRVDVAARLARLGEPIEIAPLADGETLTVERAEAIAARIARLPVATARVEATALVARWQAGSGGAPAIANAVARAALVVGDRATAGNARAAALAGLADEPSRARLEALVGLADAGEGESSHDAATRALAMFDALPELDSAPRARLERMVRARRDP